MEKLLTQDDLAKRWGVTKRTIDNWRLQGVLQPCEGLPVIRFHPDYIAQLENVKKDKMSAIERKKLENKIEELEHEKSKLISMLSGMFANYPEFIRIREGN